MPDKYFTQIKDELIRSDKLTPHEKAVLNVLLSYGDCKEIFIGQSRLAKESNMSRKTVNAAVKSLTKKKLISTRLKPDRSTLVYMLNTEVVVTESDNVVTLSDKGCNGKLQGVVTESDTSNKSISNKTIDKENNKKKVSPEEIPFTEILEYLSKVSGKRHNVNKLNKKYISGRWRDGHRLPDFKKVIDVCNAKWKDNKDMCDFIQPSTLFNTKFEERLNWSLPKEEFHPAQRPDYDDSELPYNKQAIIDMQRARND
jgi:uncharacterized phage protein (TIGR02220 family)